jgi:hypothetical protein
MTAYNVEIKTSDRTDQLTPRRRVWEDQLVEIWRNHAGQIHREDGPAIVAKDPTSGAIQEFAWYRNGLMHRDGENPAAMWEDDEGRTRHYEWYSQGELHRYNGPAELMLRMGDHDGPFEVPLVVSEDWYKNGKAHRIGGPASFYICDIVGAVLYESWYEDGELHRIEGPAHIERKDDLSGELARVEWYRHGKLHRSDGPALSTFNEKTGAVECQEYYLDGAQVDAVGLPKPAP